MLYILFKFLRLKTLTLLAIIIFSCANPQSPSGGPPDKTPPEIEEYEPANNSLNFQGNSIRIQFSKYMDRNSISENIFISPSKKYSLSWSRRELEIEFLESLDTNTTYTVSLGTDIADSKGNKPTESFNLTFSTGNNIDSGKIKGQLFDLQPAGAFIFAYPIDKINPDTLNPKNNKPPFKVQIGSNGLFQIPALKNGKYRLFAIRDKFKDGIYDPGIDGFGAATSDVEVVRDTSKFVNIKIGGSIDRIQPMLTDALPVSNRIVRAVFSENIDTFSVSKNSFSISDSTGKRKLDIAGTFISKVNGRTVEIITSSPMVPEKKWQLTVCRDSIYIPKDSSGNRISDSAFSIHYQSTPEQDTIKPILDSSPFRDSTTGISPTAVFRFMFSTAIGRNFNDSTVKFIKVSPPSQVPFLVMTKADNYFVVKPLERLSDDSWYDISFRTNKITDVIGNVMKDSTIKLRFQTLDSRTFGAASGKLLASNISVQRYVVTLLNKLTKVNYSTKVNSKGSWEINDLPQGEYSLEIFEDLYGNGFYYYGSDYPHKFGARFYVMEKEINIKPRWTLEDIKIEIPQ
ncbi:MAG: Big 5 protein [Ignavibacteria bacterium]|nr:Big 5 protein [Ignavibacteria bacterium]